jgi:hypothetical protein
MASYCCKRFQESVKDKYIIKSIRLDETAWFLKDWLHIYYCPFCGKNIKGKGFGQYDIETQIKIKGGKGRITLKKIP